MYQIENDGNFEGEVMNQLVIQLMIGSMFEFFLFEWNFLIGCFVVFQEYKVWLWSNYQFEFGCFGYLNVGGLVNYDLGMFYSLVDNSFLIIVQQVVGDLGYVMLLMMSNVFFGECGLQFFDDVVMFDFVLCYGIDFGCIQLWIKVEIFNVFDNDKFVIWDIEIFGNIGGLFDVFGLLMIFIEGFNFGWVMDDVDYVVFWELCFLFGLCF